MSGLPSSVEAQTRIKLPRVFQLQSSSLRLRSRSPTLHSSSSFPLHGLHMLHDIDLREIFECAHLKFTVSGRSKHSQIHTHFRNAVTLSVGLAQARPNNLRKIRLVTLRAPFLDFCTRQQGLNAAGAGHIWTFSPLHGFNYHQLASAEALVRQWAAPVIGHATI